MPFEQVEQKKREYTDKYVVVDPSRPELARFKGVVGQVKTVNMSGRALVEFMDYHLNVGWYDIDPEFLKVVDKPPPKVEKPAAKKPAAKAEAKPAAAKPQAAKAPVAAKGDKPSVADILAAARGGKGGGTAPAAPKAEAAPAAAKPQVPAKPAVDRSKMSVADMIAAARAGGAPQAAPTAKAPVKPAPAQEPPAPPEPVDAAEEPVVESPPAGEVAAATGKPADKIDKSKMTIDDILAWCREHDAK